MVINYDDVPCVIKYNNCLYKVEKPKKFFNKHREMNDGEVEFFYIDKTITGMREIAVALQKKEDDLNGIVRAQNKQEGLRPWTHTYRVNRNTVLCAYSEEELNNLKKRYNVD